MSLFWASLALSDGTRSEGRVENALGLTGILISALLVVSQLTCLPELHMWDLFIQRMRRIPLGFIPPHNIVHEHKLLEQVCLPPPKEPAINS